MLNEIKLMMCAALRIDGGTQSRMSIDETVVADYRDTLLDDVELPPVIVFRDEEGINWLADGFHRLLAHQQAGIDTIRADVRAGSRRDAVLFSCGANSDHGLRRTIADKRRAVETLLNDAEWAAWSDRQIAKRCGVSHTMVASTRILTGNSASDNEPPIRKFVDKHGIETTMNTTAINVNRADEKPESPPKASAEIPPAKAATEPHVQIEGCSHVEYDEIEELRERYSELASMLKEAMGELNILHRVTQENDQVTAALAEVKRVEAHNQVLEDRLRGVINELAAAQAAARRWQLKAQKLEAKS
jgi:hypothetical protein